MQNHGLQKYTLYMLSMDQIKECLDAQLLWVT